MDEPSTLQLAIEHRPKTAIPQLTTQISGFCGRRLRRIWRSDTNVQLLSVPGFSFNRDRLQNG